MVCLKVSPQPDFFRLLVFCDREGVFEGRQVREEFAVMVDNELTLFLLISLHGPSLVPRFDVGVLEMLCELRLQLDARLHPLNGDSLAPPNGAR